MEQVFKKSGMTVQDLIDALSKVSDKQLPVRMSNWRDEEDLVLGIEIEPDGVDVIPCGMYG